MVDGALQIASGFNDITRVVEHMAARTLSELERREFAATALRVRYLHAEHIPVQAEQLLSARRSADFGNSLWLTYNVVQLCGARHNCTYVDKSLMRSYQRDSRL